MNQNLHNARTSPVRKKHYSTPHSPLSTQLSISPLTHSQSHNILGNALQRRFTLCSVGFMYICVWKCRYLGDSSDVDDVAESSRHPLPWLPLPLSPFSCLLSTSFAFNHVERREKRRLVFAKSFNACESRAQEQREGLLLVWVWSGLGCLSLIINNENDGVKSCRCAMPNAGISFMVQARLVSAFQGVATRTSRARSEVPVNGHSASGWDSLSLGNLTRGYKLRNCVHFKKRKLHNSATYGHAVRTRLSSECECELWTVWVCESRFECENCHCQRRVKVKPPFSYLYTRYTWDIRVL